MATWATTAIRQRYPNAFICWAVEERCVDVIDRDELVNELMVVPRQKWRSQRWTPKVLGEQIEICRKLKRMNFDFGIDLQGHLKTAVCLKFARPKRRISVNATDAISKLLNPVPERMPAKAHWVEWQNHVLQNFGPFPLPILPIMPCAPKVQPKLVTISTSAGHPSKVYPINQWRAVAQNLVADGYQVAFLGALGDPDIELEGARSYVGKLSLAQSMSMVASSELHLAGDTGTGHMAAAYGVPVVSVFGHMDPANYRPYTHRGVVLRRGMEASAVTSEEVIEASRTLIRSQIA